MFDNDAEAVEELRTRTSKKLGGGVSERIFLEEFILPAGILYSQGWWLSRSLNEDEVFFFVVKNELSAFDHEISGKLTANNYPVYQIVCLADHYEISDGTGFYTIEEFLRLRGLAPAPMRPRKLQNGEIINRCIEYYRQTGMLQTEARSIRIEDMLLNQYFYTSNIDLFVKQPDTDQIACIEIKFKNQFTYNGSFVFGEDILQYEKLFPIMRSSGIDVYNCVLYNHLKQIRNTDTTDVFNYLDACGGQHYWKKKKFVDGEVHNKYSFDAGHTAWGDSKGRTVYCIPLREYQAITTDLFRSDPNNYWGDCPRAGCDGKLVLRSRRDGSGEFFGCSDYKRHNN